MNPLPQNQPIHESERHRQIYRRLNSLSTLMDDAFLFPGTDIRFGLDVLVGLIPVIGDVGGALVSLYIIATARQMGLSKWDTARMLGNVALELLLGSIPIVGDIFDVGWRANRRNMSILAKYLPKEEQSNRKSG